MSKNKKHLNQSGLSYENNNKLCIKNIKKNIKKEREREEGKKDVM